MEFCRTAPAEPFSSGEAARASFLGGMSAAYVKEWLHLQQTQEPSFAEALRTELRPILYSDLSLQEKLAIGLEKLCGALGGGHGHFYIKDRASGDFVLQASTVYPSHLYGLIRVREGEGLVGETAQKRRSTYLEEPEFHSSQPPRALLCIPLATPSALAGVLSLEQVPAGPRPQKQLAVIEDLGREWAQIILRDLQYQQMGQKLLKLSVLQEKGLELLSSADEAHLVSLVTASAVLLVEAEAAILRIYSQTEKRLVVRSNCGLHDVDLDKRLVELDHSIAQRTFQDGRSRSLEGLDQVDPSLPPRFPYRYAVCTPLFCSGAAVGTLSVYNKLAYHSFGCTGFDPDDTEILEKFSGYFSKALSDIRQVQVRSEEATVDERTGLKNERYLLLRLPEEIRRAERHERSLSLLVIEAKEWDEVRLPGRLPGEGRLLKHITEVLQETFRNVDVLVRICDARFAALMPDTGEAVADAAARLARSLSSLPVRIFIGHSTYPTEVRTAQDLISRASKMSEVFKQV